MPPILILSSFILFQLVGGILWSDEAVNRLFSEEFYNALLYVNDTEPSCVNQMVNFVNGLKERHIYAQKALDSWGSIPAGLFSENHIDFGHFDQCVQLEFIDSKLGSGKSQYCLVGVFKDDLFIQLGVCLPKACSANVTGSFLYPILHQIGLDLNQIDYCTSNEPKEWKALQLITFALIASIILLCIFGTVEERLAIVKHEPTSLFVRCFSLARNAKRLFDTKNANKSIGCLDGIRVISFVWIVFYHTFSRDFTLTNYNTVEMILKRFSWRYAFISSGNLAVDSFLTMTGLLISHQFIEARMKKQPFNLAKFYIHRYIRLMPALAFAGLTLVAFMQTVDGPNGRFMEKTATEIKETWWRDITATKNFFPPTFFGHTWTIAVDLQLFCLSPLLLFSLVKWHYRFVVVLSLAVLLLNLSTFYTLCITVSSPVEFSTLSRAPAWIIGLILGFILQKTNDDISHLSKRDAYLVSSIVGLVMLLCIYLFKFCYNAIFYTIYESFHRTLWALCLAWVIFSCHYGYSTGASNFLSHPCFKIVSNLTYCAFLWHLPVQIISKSIQRFPEYFNGFLFFRDGISNVVVSLMVALPWSLLFELPFINIQRLIEQTLKKRLQRKITSSTEALKVYIY